MPAFSIRASRALTAVPVTPTRAPTPSNVSKGARTSSIRMRQSRSSTGLAYEDATISRATRGSDIFARPLLGPMASDIIEPALDDAKAGRLTFEHGVAPRVEVKGAALGD